MLAASITVSYQWIAFHRPHSTVANCYLWSKPHDASDLLYAETSIHFSNVLQTNFVATT